MSCTDCGGPTKTHGALRCLTCHGKNRAKAKPRTYTPKSEEIPSGTCECGCGRLTPIAKVTYRKLRQFRGHPLPYVRGHGHKTIRHRRVIADSPADVTVGGNWVGAGGYVLVYAPTHPEARSDGSVAQHRVVMEKKLGRFLEPHEEPHHKDGDRTNNSLKNLELRKVKHGRGIRSVDYHCPGCRCT